MPEQVAYLAWAVCAGPGYRMLQRARAAVTEAQKDNFYTVAAAQARRGRTPRPDSTHRQCVKRCSAAGMSPHPPSGPGAGVVHLIAAMGLGVEEAGAEAFADAITATGLFPQLSAQEWRDAMLEACASGIYVEEFATLTRFDPVEALENADIKQLRRAREVATELAGFGAILLMHGESITVCDRREAPSLCRQVPAIYCLTSAEHGHRAGPGSAEQGARRVPRREVPRARWGQYRIDPDLAGRESVLLGAALRRVRPRPARGRAAVVGHSPVNEATVLGLAGRVVPPLGKGKGVLLTGAAGPAGWRRWTKRR